MQNASRVIVVGAPKRQWPLIEWHLSHMKGGAPRAMHFQRLEDCPDGLTSQHPVLAFNSPVELPSSIAQLKIEPNGRILLRNPGSANWRGLGQPRMAA